MKRISCTVFLLLAPLSCSSGSTPLHPAEDVGFQPQDVNYLADEAGSVVFSEVEVSDRAGPPDLDPADESADLPDPATPGTTKCQSNADCPGGFCVHGWDGDVCTTPCVETCPDGWVCKQMPLGRTDIVFACLPVHVTLCNPCKTDQDCMAAGYQVDAFCQDRGELGSFCTEPCFEGTTCPSGYQCAQVNGPGRSGKYCLYQDPGCECHGVAVAHALETICSVTNGIGECRGLRRCTPSGLSDCDAPVPAAEDCDGIDNDCDGKTDDGFPDCDADGMADCVDPDLDGDGVLEDGDGDGVPGSHPCAQGYKTGCDDNCPKCGYRNPEQEDTNGDGIGDLCDPCVGDKDLDGFSACLDCDDLDPKVHPGAVESCNGKDDDCDGVTDPEDANGCKVFYKDQDGDGYGLDTAVRCLCKAEGAYTAQVGGDCDDVHPTAHPDGIEVCNGIDDDCDGTIDGPGLPGCVAYYLDADGDGYGDGKQWKCYCGPFGGYTTPEKGDCDDANPATHPGAKEICDEQDNDCDGLTDEDADKACATDCGSGKQACVNGTLGECTAPQVSTCVDYGGDCSDYTTCGDCVPRPADACNGKDDDCDGTTDPGYGFQDWDGQSKALGEPCGTGGCWGGTVVCAKDGSAAECSTKNEAIPESCNGVDDDCDGVADNGVSTEAFPDADGDGFGDPAGVMTVCELPAGYGITGGDCDDSNPEVHPGQTETCNGHDDDCDGQTDGNDRPCDLGCGPGKEVCTGGDWGGCDAPGPKTCLDYSTCGVRGMCVTDCPAAPAEACNAVDDDCDGKTDETFTCRPGDKGSESCGACGTRSRICDGNCQWGGWEACVGGGGCTPGKEETQGCGNCGSQKRTCGQDCTWGDWSKCGGEGVCKVNQTQSQGCGNCGSQSRTCGGNCQWGGWSGCGGQGCAPGSTTGGGCEPCSHKVCQGNCQWGGCQLKAGAQCSWNYGCTYRCCAWHKGQWCLGPEYGCIWSDQCAWKDVCY
jgi:hypothetical protein